jgi:uncharacterized protein (DUF362 family)
MKKPRGMSRREFFAAGAGIAGGVMLSAGAMSGSGPIAGRWAAAAAGKSRVALVVTGSRAEGVKKCLDLLKFNLFKGKNVLIKPNFNTSDETPGSTHNETLKAILERAREMGAKSLTIGDRSGPEATQQVFDKKGIPALAGAFDAKLLNFDELGAEGYVTITPPGSHWKDGFLIAKPVVGAECLVSTCCLKTHQFGGVFTMSLKNSVGAVPRKGTTLMRELHSDPADQPHKIAEINFAYKPALIVLDGLVAFVDRGPMEGPRKDAGVFLAGTDRVAVDAVGVAILKQLGSNDAIMKPAIFAQGQIARAVELGLGVASAAGIVITTPDAASEAYAGKIRAILAAG